MLIIFYALMTLLFGCWADEYQSETKTVAFGETVILSCPREISRLSKGTWYWIRLVSGNSPELLGATFNFKHDGVSKTPHIKVKQEEGTFLLQVYKATRKDSGLYYCVQVKTLDMIFMTGTFLKIKGAESDITTIIQKPSSGPISPGDPVTLQCSVLSDSEKKTCSADHRVSWFRAGSDESHPNLIYAHGNTGEDCEFAVEPDSVKKCSYNFSKTISSSDTGTYYCAVATCGQILFGNGTKLDVEDSTLRDPQSNIILILVSVALAVSLAVICCLIYTIKKKSCRCSNDAACSANWLNKHKQRDEHTLVYSAPTFTKSKLGKAERRNKNRSPEETVYNDVRTTVRKD